MRVKIMVAIVLIALGIVAFAYQGITYTTRGSVFDVGPMHMTTERTNHIPLPPVFGAIALIGGLALLLLETKRSHAAG